MTTGPLSGPQTDLRFMQAALALGRRGLGRTAPNPAVGALVVDADGHVAGRGWTQPGGRPHAETEALGRAGARARGGTLYVTLEPCSHFGRTPPCADAVIAAGISRVVIAIEDPNPLVGGQGSARLRAAGVAVEVGAGAEAARRDHAGHLARVLRGRPHVQLKLAVSADDKAALPGRRPAAITGPAARAHAHLLRAEADAIAVGIGTVLADDPALTCRLPGMEDRSPIRVVFDGALRTPLTAQLVRGAAVVPSWVIAAEDAAPAAERRLVDAGVEVLRVDRDGAGGLDLAQALAALSARGVTRLLVEGGPILAAALLRADLADEFVLYRAPVALGPEAVPALDGLDLERMLADPAWPIVERRSWGPDAVTVRWRSGARA